MLRAIPFAWTMLVAIAATAANFDTQTLNETNVVLFNEKVLQGALSDIAKMQEAELRAFTRYLSVCKTLGNLGDDPTCSEVKASYSIEFGGKRRLDDLISSMTLRDMLDRDRVAHGERGIFDGDWIMRESFITVEIQEAASARFRALRNDKEKP
jgi:hypothetical protein